MADQLPSHSVPQQTRSHLARRLLIIASAIVLPVSFVAAVWPHLGNWEKVPRARFWEKFSLEGRKSLEHKETKEAIDNYNLAVEEARHLGNSDMRLGFALDDLGTALFADNQWQPAKAAFDEALEVYNRCLNSTSTTDVTRKRLLTDGIARASAGAGAVSLAAKDYEQARQFFVAALAEFETIARETGSPIVKQEIVRVLIGLGDANLGLAKPADAESFFRRAMDLSDACLGSTRLRRQIKQGYSKLLGLSGRGKEKKALLNSMPESASEQNLQQLIAEGKTSFQQGEYDQAEIKFTRALNGARQADDKVTEAMINRDLAQVYFFEKRFGLTLQAGRQALAIKAGTSGPDDDEVDRILNALIRAALESKDYQQALPYLERQKEIVTRIYGADSAHSVANKAHTAYALHLKGDEAQADKLSAEVLQEVPNFPRKLRIATALDYIGRLFQERKDYARAESLYKESLEMRRNIRGDGTKACESLVLLGRLYVQMHSYAKAEETYKKALSIMETDAKRSDQDLAQILVDQADCFLLQNKTKEALSALRRAAQISSKYPYMKDLNSSVSARCADLEK